GARVLTGPRIPHRRPTDDLVIHPRHVPRTDAAGPPRPPLRDVAGGPPDADQPGVRRGRVEPVAVAAGGEADGHLLPMVGPLRWRAVRPRRVSLTTGQPLRRGGMIDSGAVWRMEKSMSASRGPRWRVMAAVAAVLLAVLVVTTRYVVPPWGFVGVALAAGALA